MLVEEQPTLKPCKKLQELPSVTTDWQQTTWCPNCEHYHCGTCGFPVRTGTNPACPFDGQPLPLREVEVGPKGDQPQKPPKAALRKREESQGPPRALDQAIQRRIASRTGGRIQSLEVELIGSQMVIRGRAPCYHVKQLALQEAVDVIRSADEAPLELILQMEVCPATSESGTP
jgi:hypothetical protein